MATFIGTILRDIINGTALSDVIQGLGGNDHLLGHDGNDVIHAGGGVDILEGGRGNDRLVAEGDAFSGALGDSLFGGEGSDILVSSGGADLLNGGSGIDAASYETASGAVAANLSTGRATVGSATDTLVQLENLIGSRFGDTLRGDNARNEIFGANGADKLYGQGGNDNLSGGTGDDTLDGGSGLNILKGGAGFDTADYSTLGFGIDADLVSGQVFASDRLDGLSEIEGVRGTNVGDRITGNAFGNLLSGNGGNDRLDGSAGNDIVSGGTGADTFAFVTIEPKFGPDINSGFDRIDDFSRAQGDRIDLTDHKEATDFANLRASASQFGTDTHLRLGADTIVLEDVALSQLSAQMFLF